MLRRKILNSVVKETRQYWKAEVKRPYFIQMAAGKEIGHKMADLVEEKTAALLTVKFQTKYQRDSRGHKRIRSMGDVWLLDGNIYHPVNVKTGVVGSEGQPNLVSLKRLLSAIIEKQIDSYYLLMIKMDIPDNINANSIKPSVVFTDILDWLPHIAFDAGPGQMMLKSKNFFQHYDSHSVPTRTLSEKLGDLFAHYQDGQQRLKENRERDLAKYRDALAEFLKSANQDVTPDTQKGLGLQ